jgi:hypothetical protein
MGHSVGFCGFFAGLKLTHFSLSFLWVVTDPPISFRDVMPFHKAKISPVETLFSSHAGDSLG